MVEKSKETVKSTISGIAQKWTKTYKNGKKEFCAEVMRVFKPLVIDGEIRKKSCAAFGRKAVDMTTSLVEKAESYLKSQDPERFGQVMEEVKESAKYFNDKFDWKEKKYDLEKRVRLAISRADVLSRDRKGCPSVYYVAEAGRLEAEKPERLGIVKRIIARRKSNPRE